MKGRVLINLWRVWRSELKLTSYSLPSVAWHVLGTRLPVWPGHTLMRWWRQAPLQHTLPTELQWRG